MSSKVRCCLVALMIFCLNGPMLSSAQGVVPVGEDALDLAEMIPYPEDISFLMDGEQAATNRSEYHSQQGFIDGQSDDFSQVEGVFDTLTEAGFQQAYVHEYTDVQDEGQNAPAITIRSRLGAFADEDGASEVYELLLEHLGADESRDAVGDASFIFEDTSETSEARGIELTFRIGNVLAISEIWNTDGTPPAQRDVEELAGLLLDQIDAVQNGDGTSLGLLVLRPNYAGTFNFDGYRVIDSQPMPRPTETAEGVIAWAGDATTAYYVVVSLPDPRDPAENLGYQARTLRFETEDAASDWVADAETFILDGFSQIISAEPVDEPDRIGDESRAIAVRGQRSSGDKVPGTLIVTRVGSIVSTIMLTSMLDVSVEAVEPLAAMQAACIEEGSCEGTVVVDRALIEGEDAPSGDEASTGDGDVYESPLFGYTLEYDADEWEISAEDDDPDDDYDRVRFDHELGIVGLIGDPDYDEDELDACVADYQQGFEHSEGVSDVREMRAESGESRSSVWAVFSYDFEGSDQHTVEAVRYIECRTLDDGITLVILQDSLEADYDDLSEAREDLMNGFEAS